MSKFYLINERQLEWLRRSATRLYTEDRMNGDQMRDMAHALSKIADDCEELEVPPEDVFGKEFP